MLTTHRTQERKRKQKEKDYKKTPQKTEKAKCPTNPSEVSMKNL